MCKFITCAIIDLTKINKKKLVFYCVRDWKGYGIVQQCGTCEPMQSPTDVALERMICRAMEGTPKT